MYQLKDEATAPATFETVVREKVRNDVLTGVLQPNSRLGIRALCERYGVGASPLREALSKLVPEGLIYAKNNRGFWVAPLSYRELIEISEMRQIIEGEAFRRSIANGDDSWEASIVATFHRLKKHLQNPPVDQLASRLAWEVRHREFHLSLISACGNSKLLANAEHLYQHFARYRALLQLNELPDEKLIKIHLELMNCALSRDQQLAAATLFGHFTVNIAQLQKNLSEAPDMFAIIGQNLDEVDHAGDLGDEAE